MRLMPDLEGEEMLFVGGLVKEMTDTQAETFRGPPTGPSAATP